MSLFQTGIVRKVQRIDGERYQLMQIGNVEYVTYCDEKIAVAAPGNKVTYQSYKCRRLGAPEQDGEVPHAVVYKIIGPPLPDRFSIQQDKDTRRFYIVDDERDVMVASDYRSETAIRIVLKCVVWWEARFPD